MAALLCGAILLSGCGDPASSLLAVKAVAAGVASLAPFFDEGERLGRDEPRLTPLKPHSGLQQGNAPGLYGGTQEPKVCDVRKLEDFLTAPGNKKKAQEWARVTGVKADADGIGRYLDVLTPVLLRHDTLVKNHDYKKGKAVPFDALLEAGIAVLVDDQGLPAVKCSCGNPLRAFDADPGRIDVEFPDDKEWKGYDESAVVVVEPAPEQLKEIKLVDVQDPGRGIGRAVGTTGESDRTFDARARQAVPVVRGMTFGEASAAMADRGLAVTVAGDELPVDDAPVTGSSPGPGTELEFGAAVALRVERPGGTPEESTGEEPGSGPGSSGSGSGSTRLGPTEPSEGGGSPTDGAPSESGSTPTDGNTTPAGGGSVPQDTGSSDTGPSGGGTSGGGTSGTGPSGTGPSNTGPSDGGAPSGSASGGGTTSGGAAGGGAAPTVSVAPPSTGGTSLVPSPAESSEEPASQPDPPPSPSVPASASGLSASGRTPPPPASETSPDPAPPEETALPADKPAATGDPEPADGSPTDPPGVTSYPGLPVEDPAQLPVRI
ncbi:DUF6777 domain-containing protein [Streptomyces sp. NPDC057438]|uniref:DUF6777 domain-containing protein n=1 Tax=Streptomyces sp. NPDC057438 TaxID=3346133 RepID=UPI0036813E77